MKKIFGFIFILFMCLSSTSCSVVAEAQTEDVYVLSDGVDVDVIITYGAPYYNANGLLLYYIYRGYYYYPYYSSDRWYFRPYSRPVRYYRPVPRDFYHHRPHFHTYSRYNSGMAYRNGRYFNRPSHQMRSSTMVRHNSRHQMSRGGAGRFGGRR